MLWVNGPNIFVGSNPSGVRGVAGIPSVNNYPSARGCGRVAGRITMVTYGSMTAPERRMNYGDTGLVYSIFGACPSLRGTSLPFFTVSDIHISPFTSQEMPKLMSAPHSRKKVVQ